MSIAHGQRVLAAGEPVASARAAMILLHGRGASAEDIMTIASEVQHPGWAYLAPQAVGNAWVPGLQRRRPVHPEGPCGGGGGCIQTDGSRPDGSPLPWHGAHGRSGGDRHRPRPGRVDLDSKETRPARLNSAVTLENIVVT